MTKSEQARADAMADAETLRLVVGYGAAAMSTQSRLYRTWLHLDAAGRYGHWTFQRIRLARKQGPWGAGEARAAAVNAARAAFRAVPGLRGE